MSKEKTSKPVTRSPKRKPKPKRPSAPGRASFPDSLILKATTTAAAKTYAVDIKATGENVVTVTASTFDVDAVGDRINPLGWQLDQFRANPIILWAHDYRQPPIGRALEVWSTGAALKARIEFAPKEISPFAHQVYQLIKAKFINSVSVGFRSLRQTPNSHGGFDILEARLHEISIVPLPALAQARIDQRAVAAKMKKWLGGRGGRDVVFSLVDDTPELRRRRADREAAERREIAAMMRASVAAAFKRK